MRLAKRRAMCVRGMLLPCSLAVTEYRSINDCKERVILYMSDSHRPTFVGGVLAVQPSGERAACNTRGLRRQPATLSCSIRPNCPPKLLSLTNTHTQHTRE